MASAGDLACFNPKCKSRFTQEFIRDMLGKDFYTNEFRPVYENQLFEIEKRHFPSALREIELRRERSSLNEKINEAKKARASHEERVESLYKLCARNRIAGKSNVDNDEEIIRIQILIENLSQRIEEWRAQVQQISPEARKYIRQCPVRECRGMLDEYYMCSMCLSHICERCHVPTMDGHSCKREDLDSVLALKDAKPCPCCSRMIFREDGCDQMWCTMCKTPFSWDKGTIETGRIHNPHYYEWLRTTHHEEQQVLCGGIPSATSLRTVASLPSMFIRNVHRFALSCESGAEIPLSPFDLIETRIKFLTKKISEKKFKEHIVMRYCEREKLLSEMQCIATFALLFGDIMRTWMEKTKNLEPSVHNVKWCQAEDEFVNEIIQLIRFTNTNLLHTAEIFATRESARVISYNLSTAECSLKR